MGLLSGIGKAIKSVFKGIGKVFKAIGKGVKKLFSSAFGKVLLVAAAVFFGGMALGLWASPFATTAAAGSTAAGTAMAAETATGVGLAETAGLSAHMGAAAGTVGASVGGGVGTAAGTMSTMPIAEAVSTSATGIGGAGGSAAGLIEAGSAAGGAAGLAPVVNATGSVIQGAGSSLWGTVTSTASSVGSWMSAHPMLTMMGGNMLSSMFTPSKAEEEIEVEEWKRENSTIAGVGYDGSGPGIDFTKMREMAKNYNISSPLPFGPNAQLGAAAKYAKSSYDPEYYNREEEKRKRNAGLLKQNMTGA